MKRNTFCLVAVLALASLHVSAQTPNQDTQAAEPATTPAPRTPDSIVDMLTTRLSLSDDQKAKIAPIIADRQEKMRAVMNDTSSRPRQRMRQAKGIREESDKQINAILTPDQRQTYKQIEQEMQQQMRQRLQDRQQN